MIGCCCDIKQIKAMMDWEIECVFVDLYTSPSKYSSVNNIFKQLLFLKCPHYNCIYTKQHPQQRKSYD